jgi:glycosyltransferase involved in cell wall biosynthesis
VRVALIGPVPPRLGGLTPGGVATHQVHLAEGLAAAGIEAPLLATNTAAEVGCWRAPKDQAPYALYRMTRGSGVELRALAASGGVGNVVRYALRIAPTRRYGPRREVLRNTLVYRRFLAEVRPGVLHVQHPLDRCLFVRLVRRIERWRLPLVVTAHSLFGEHADDTIHRLMAPNLRAAERVIAVSDHIAEQAVELGVDPRRVRVIRSGVDTARFQPRDRVGARERLEIPNEAHLVLFVGNLEPRKQVDVLLRAVARLRERLPTLRLLVVGSGESAGVEDQTARLRQLGAELGLADVVRFTGRLDEEALLDAYAAADVFALPSSSEAQGIVALEAMACGLAVVATAVGGLLGTIDDGRTGFLVPSGDVTALAERLEAVLADAERRATVGAAARREVESHFAWRRTVEQTLKVYGEALACL